MQVEKATYDPDLPHAATGDTRMCDFCKRNADDIIHKSIEQAAHHGEPLITEKGS